LDLAVYPHDTAIFQKVPERHLIYISLLDTATLSSSGYRGLHTKPQRLLSENINQIELSISLKMRALSMSFTGYAEIDGKKTSQTTTSQFTLPSLIPSPRTSKTTTPEPYPNFHNSMPETKKRQNQQQTLVAKYQKNQTHPRRGTHGRTQNAAA